MKKTGKNIVKPILKILGNLLMVAVCILTLVVNIIAPWGREALDGYIGTYAVKTDKDKMAEYLALGEEYAAQVQAEGSVLVKNEGVLPLDKGVKKVNVFGWAATDWHASGSGSAQTLPVQTDFLTALKDYGIKYNTQITDMYEKFLPTNPYSNALHNYADKVCRLYEPSISDEDYYSADMLVKASYYSDVAIVVLGRYTGESIDCPRTQYKITETKEGSYDELKDIARDYDRTYLDISTEEEELLKYCGSHFSTVIVVVNSTNQMNLGFLDRISGLDACLVVGGTGIHAASVIPQILYGEINPSGRLTDTYVYDFSTSSTYTNSGEEGEGHYTNGVGRYPADGVTTNPNVGDYPKYEYVSYVDYVESIYVGYKWYETADAEGYWDDVKNVYGEGYEGVVQYPFGYGLSYTTFSQEIVNTSPVGGVVGDGEKMSITVKVTNTGGMDGKDVVQLYYTPPYEKGGIEKSHVELLAFAKTKLLEPGESQEITFDIDFEDMASYDCYDANRNGFSGYELEKGYYEIKLMKNAHELVSEDSLITYTVTAPILYYTDSVTGAVVSNKFTGTDALDGVAVDGRDSGANIVFLSRADFAGTFPQRLAPNRLMTDNVADFNVYTEEDANAWMKESDSDITTDVDSGMLLYDKNGFTQLALDLGGNYNDARWEELLNQLSYDEMKNMVLHGYTKTMEALSIGKIQTKDYDGPAQMGGFANCVQGETTGFPNSTVLAQTWNTQLAYEFGKIEGAQAGQLGIEGWYAPAANLHRTPFGGRNYEYYSEDELLSGYMAAKTVEGSLDAGTYCYMKHLLGYEQDSMRDSLYTWMTEQAMREIYLVPFKIAIREGGLTGIMTSYNRIGAVWAGGSYALMTGVIRQEYGFQGTIITDYSDHQGYMNMDEALRAGGDLWMDGFVMGDFAYETESNSFKQALRRACKNIIYMWVNAGYENAEYNKVQLTATTPAPIIRPVEIKQISLVTWIQVGWDVFAAVTIFFWVRGMILRKKHSVHSKRNIQ